MNFSHAREVDDLVEAPAHLGPRHAEDGAVQEHVLAAGQLGMEAGADLEQAGHPALDRDPPLGRLGDARQDLEQRRLARAVVADDADHLAALDLEIDVAQRPELLDDVALDHGAAAQHVGALAQRIAKAARHASTNTGADLGAMADDEFLAELLGADDDVGHVRSMSAKARSLRRKECAPHTSMTGDDDEADQEARPVDRAVAAQDAPAEAVDHADHGIDAVEHLPVLGHDLAGEADRRDVEADLGDERDDEAEVAVLDDQRGRPDRRADRRQQRQQHEDRQQQDLPAGHHAVPQHQAGQDRETHQEIDQRDHDRRQRHDQTREVDLADQVGVADHADRGLAQHRGEQRPGQQAREHHDRVGCAALRRQLGERAEHHGEDHHGHERPHEGPDDADHGLLVAHRDVAPGQDEEELPVAPEIEPVLVVGPARFEDQRGRLSWSKVLMPRPSYDAAGP